MNDAGLLAALAAAIVAVLYLAVRYAWYRATHPYTEGDMKRQGRESIRGSRRTKGGQVADQLAPLLPEFYERYDPKDARFLGGGPIDFVIFEGLDDGDVRRIIFLDVKTGSGDLNVRQRQVKRAVEAGLVDFDVLKLPRVWGDMEDDLLD